MAKYILTRVLRSMATLLVIITVVFVLLRQMPIEGYFNNFDKMKPAQIRVGLAKQGLDKPIPVQLVGFYKNLARGDLGTSNRYRVNYPITKIVADKAPLSIGLGLLSMSIALLVGLPLGIMMARSTKSRLKLWDKFGTVFVVFVQAIPSSVYHILIQLFGTEWFGFSTLYDPGDWRTWILPVFSLSLGSIAYYAMWLRRYMVDEGNKDYVRLAQAKGVPEGQISRAHIFRNAFVPMIQYIPTSLLLTMVGSIYVESLYSIPGMGGLLVDVIKRQDNTVVQALVLIYAGISIIGLLLGDILMAVVDPRIKLGVKEDAR